jgi:hypothetical protein
MNQMKLKDIMSGIICNSCKSELQPMTAEDHLAGNFTHVCITPEMKIYFEELKKQMDECKTKGGLMIMLPIEYIGKIPVSAYCEKRINCRDEAIYRLQVNLNTFNCYHEGGGDAFTLYESDPWGIPMEILTFENLKNEISMLMDEEQVWLDVLTGEFRLGKETNDKLKARAVLRSSFLKTFKGKNGYKLKDKTCCVCYEPTNSKTQCGPDGHSLCVSCLVGVDEKNRYGDDDADVPCPMCRACIKYEWKQ